MKKYLQIGNEMNIVVGLDHLNDLMRYLYIVRDSNVIFHRLRYPGMEMKAIGALSIAPLSA